MEIIYYSNRLRSYITEKKAEGKSIGFVPTMGAIHEGHVSLIQEAMLECDLVVCSIFVNPKQFNNPSDLEKYPRNEQKDFEILEKIGCQVIYFPKVEDVYPKDFKDIIRKHYFFENVYEGGFRPGHFDGVAQVLHRFFSIVKPNSTYFGLKDYQQCILVEKLLEEYFPEIELVKCPTLRESDGLAMSSRNLRLSTKYRIQAAIFPRALEHIKMSFKKKSLSEAILEAKEMLTVKGLKYEYLDVVDAITLEKISDWLPKGQNVVLGAVLAGEVRLIDNMVF